MDNQYLMELLNEVEQRGGGLVLGFGEFPKAVVLTVDKYNQLLQGAAVLETTVVRSPAQPAKSGVVLVTGGAGYIGGHVVRVLLEEGFEAVVVDNLSTGKREHIPDSVVFYEGDAGDINFMRDVLSQHEIVGVIHLAASLEVAESVEFPVRYLENNAGTTYRLLQALDEAGVRTIIFSSTAAVYGEQDRTPIPENAYLKPNNPYGYSKLLSERFLEYFSLYRGFTATVLRYFNVCGTNPEWAIGDTHKNSHVLPTILDVAARKQPKITINGSDYPTADGSCVRDYVHVLDIARAHVAALRRTNSEKFAVYNVGTGKGTSVKELIAEVAEVTGRMIPIEVGPRRPGDAVITVADSGRIQQELGFTLEHSSLENIVRTSWEIAQKT